jgi:hypothetical protein
MGAGAIIALVPMLASEARAEPDVSFFQARVAAEGSLLRHPLTYHIAAAREGAALDAQTMSIESFATVGPRLELAFLTGNRSSWVAGPRLGFAYLAPRFDEELVTAIDRYEIDGRSRWYQVDIGAEIDLVDRLLVIAPAVGVIKNVDRGKFSGTGFQGDFSTINWWPVARLSVGARLPLSSSLALTGLVSGELMGIGFWEPKPRAASLTLGLDFESPEVVR